MEPDISSSLVEYIKGLNLRGQLRSIKELLSDQVPERYSSYVDMGIHPSLASAAFNALFRADSGFHRSMTSVYEQLFTKCIVPEKSHSSEVLPKLMAIVAKHRCGLSVGFLNEQLEAKQLDAELELDLFLLLIKVQEGKEGFSREQIAGRITSMDKELLTPALIYLFMRNHPKRALDYLWAMDGKPAPNMSTFGRHYQPYTFVALHGFLQKADNWDIIRSRLATVRQVWIQELVEETLARPTLRKLEKAVMEDSKGKLPNWQEAPEEAAKAFVNQRELWEPPATHFEDIMKAYRTQPNQKGVRQALEYFLKALTPYVGAREVNKRLAPFQLQFNTRIEALMEEGEKQVYSPDDFEASLSINIEGSLRKRVMNLSHVQSEERKLEEAITAP